MNELLQQWKEEKCSRQPESKEDGLYKKKSKEHEETAEEQTKPEEHLQQEGYWTGTMGKSTSALRKYRRSYRRYRAGGKKRPTSLPSPSWANTGTKISGMIGSYDNRQFQQVLRRGTMLTFPGTICPVQLVGRHNRWAMPERRVSPTRHGEPPVKMRWSCCLMVPAEPCSLFQPDGELFRLWNGRSIIFKNQILLFFLTVFTEAVPIPLRVIMELDWNGMKAVPHNPQRRYEGCYCHCMPWQPRKNCYIRKLPGSQWRMTHGFWMDAASRMFKKCLAESQWQKALPMAQIELAVKIFSMYPLTVRSESHEAFDAGWPPHQTIPCSQYSRAASLCPVPENIFNLKPPDIKGNRLYPLEDPVDLDFRISVSSFEIIRNPGEPQTLFSAGDFAAEGDTFSRQRRSVLFCFSFSSSVISGMLHHAAVRWNFHTTYPPCLLSILSPISFNNSIIARRCPGHCHFSPTATWWWFLTCRAKSSVFPLFPCPLSPSPTRPL